MFEKLTDRLRQTNETLASASKAWRDGNVSAREIAVAERELEADRKLEKVRELEQSQKWRRFGNRVVMVTVAIVASLCGFFIGASSTSQGARPVETAPALASAIKEVPGETLSGPSRALQWNSVSIEVAAPADPNGRNTLVAWRDMPNGNRESVSRRIGPSGESYGRRETDCSGDLFRYLGEGETLQSAMQDSPSPSLSPLTPQSISTEVSRVACAQ